MELKIAALVLAGVCAAALAFVAASRIPRLTAWMLDRLARRRSAAPQTLSEPGPSPQQVRDLIALGARVPDHGKLAPWRFVVIEPAPKARLVEKLRAQAQSQPNPDQAAAKLGRRGLSALSVSGGRE